MAILTGRAASSAPSFASMTNEVCGIDCYARLVVVACVSKKYAKVQTRCTELKKG